MVNTLFNCHISFQSFYNQEVVLYNFQTDVSCLLEVVINSPLRVVSKVEVVIKVVIKVRGGDQIKVEVVIKVVIKVRGGDQIKVEVVIRW